MSKNSKKNSPRRLTDFEDVSKLLTALSEAKETIGQLQNENNLYNQKMQDYNEKQDSAVHLSNENKLLIQEKRALQQEVNAVQNSINFRGEPSKIKLLEARIDSETHKTGNLTRENIELKSQIDELEMQVYECLQREKDQKNDIDTLIEENTKLSNCLEETLTESAQKVQNHPDFNCSLIHDLKNEIEKLKNINSEIKDPLSSSTLERAKESLEADLEQIYSENKKNIEKLRICENELSQLRNKFHQIINERNTEMEARIQSELELKESQLESSRNKETQKNQELLKKIRELELELKRKEESISELEYSLNTERSNTEQKSGVIFQLQGRLEEKFTKTLSFEEQLQKTTHKFEESRSKIEDLQAEITNKRSTILELKSLLYQKDDTIKTMKLEYGQSELALRNLQKECSELKQAHKEIFGENEALISQINKEQSDNCLVKSENLQLACDLNMATSKLDQETQHRIKLEKLIIQREEDVKIIDKRSNLLVIENKDLVEKYSKEQEVTSKLQKCREELMCWLDEREKEIFELKNNGEKLEKKLQNSQKSFEEFKEIKDDTEKNVLGELNGAIARYKKLVFELESSLGISKKNEQLLKSEITRLKKLLSKVKEDSDTLSRTVDIIKTEKEDLKQSGVHRKSALQKLQDDLSDARQQLLEKQKSASLSEQLTSDLTISNKRLNIQIASKRDSINQLTKELTDVKDMLSSCQSAGIEAQKLNQQLETLKKRHYEELENLTHKLHQREKESVIMRKENLSLKADLTKANEDVLHFQRNKEIVETEIKNLNRKIFTLENLANSGSLSSTKNEHKELKNENQIILKENRDLLESIRRQQNEIKELEKTTKIVGEEIEEKKDFIKEIESQNKRVTQMYERQCQEMNILTDSHYEELQKNRKIQAKLIELEKDLREVHRQLSSHKSDNKALLKELEILSKNVTENEGSKFELEDEKSQLSNKVERLELQNKRLVNQIEEQNSQMRTSTSRSKIQNEDLETLKLKISKMQTEKEEIQNQLHEVKKELGQFRLNYNHLEDESKVIVKKWNREREQIMMENEKLEMVASDRLSELETKSWQNGRLLIKLSLCYAELERLIRFRDENENENLIPTT